MTTKQFDRLILKSENLHEAFKSAKGNKDVRDFMMSQAIDLLDEMEEIVSTNW